VAVALGQGREAPAADPALAVVVELVAWVVAPVEKELQGGG
jgi:hypothetical protein